MNPNQKYLNKVYKALENLVLDNSVPKTRKIEQLDSIREEIQAYENLIKLTNLDN